MNASWDQIVDYARGLASDEVKRLVEADPEAMEKVRSLGLVRDSVTDVAPESFVNRAKALLPNLRPLPQTWIGRLVLSPSGGTPGFRSVAPVAGNLRYQFDEGFVELRREPSANAGSVAVVGFVEGFEGRQLTLTAGKSSTVCDEFGEFSLEIGADVTLLVLEAIATGDRFELHLP